MQFETEPQFNSLGKRLRDDDAGGPAAEWTEQPHRKLVFRTPSLGQSSTIFASRQEHQLPFSHSAQPNPHTPTLIPADSSSDSSNAEIRSPPLGPSVAIPSTVFTPADDDVDMSVDGHGSDLTPESRRGYDDTSPMVSPKSQTPSRPTSREYRQGRLAPIMLGTPNQTHDLSTRVPTPIYGHFSTHGGDATANQSLIGQAAAGNTGSPLRHHSRSNHYNIALYPQHNLQERKMPSPISEDFANELTMNGGLSTEQQQYLAQMQNLQAAHINLNVDEDMAMSPSSPTAPFNSVGMSRSPSIGQRRRSDAISGSSGDGSLQATEMAKQSSGHNGSSVAAQGEDDSSCGHSQRASFHMGYKADCKMCRDRVPGHFNHITHGRT